MKRERDAELALIKTALDELVKTAISEDLRWRQSSDFKYRLYKRSELESLTDEHAEIEELLERPRSAAVRWAIRRLGMRIWELTESFQEMQTIAEWVANQDSKAWGCRIDIIDKRWNGIGEWWS